MTLVSINDRLLTLDEAGELVRRTPRALRALIHAGRLPATLVGRGYLVSVDDLEIVFAPKLHPRDVAQRGESPNTRAQRQLSQAGFIPRRA